MVRLYESLFILRPTLSEEEVQKALEKAKTTIEKAGGTVERLENLGKKKLAYEIKQEKKGLYFQLHFHADGETVTELERWFRLDDTVMKFLTVKLKASPAQDSSPAPMMEGHARREA